MRERSEVRPLVGLGNPGARYARTRHNLGFLVIDALADRLNARVETGRGRYLVGAATVGCEELLLVKPTTYVNASGEAVLELVEREGVLPERVTVVCDDVNLPLGTIRLRPRGSDGGHNGLVSIIYHLGSTNFPRQRIGVGQPPAGVDLISHVLGEFQTDEMPVIKRAIERACEQLVCLAAEGIEAAMSRFNS